MAHRAVSLVIAVVVFAGCSSSPGVTSTTTTPSTSTTLPSVADPWGFPRHLVPTPHPPLSYGPSFTESDGCGAPQGIRGPYTTAAGFLDDAVAVWGPWGDYFGRQIGEVRDHLVRMELPNGDEPPVPVYVDERAAPALQLVIDALKLEALRGRVYHLDPTAVSSFWPATIPPKRYMSFHAMGIAIDVNSRTNEYREDNVLVTDMPSWFIAVWTHAGWCWGGNWQDIKDAMHFSWMGPRYTPGYAAVAPMPIRTGAADFDRSFSFTTALGAPGPATSALLGDLDRDGAPDVVHLTAGAGGLAVDAAVAIHGFFSCRPDGPTPYPAPANATPIMADVDGDARPDLVLVGPDMGFVSVVAFTHASGFTAHPPAVRTGIPAAPGSTYLLADRDRDGVVDLWIVETGAPGHLSAWAGPEYGRRLFSVSLPLALDGSWRFAAADRDGDGIADLLALGPDDLVVVDGAGGFTRATERIVTPASSDPGVLEAGDFDGDGRDDLYVLGDDGRVTVYLGGDRSGVGDESLMSWFLQRDDQPWTAWEGCPFDSAGPR